MRFRTTKYSKKRELKKHIVHVSTVVELIGKSTFALQLSKRMKDFGKNIVITNFSWRVHSLLWTLDQYWVSFRMVASFLLKNRKREIYWFKRQMSMTISCKLINVGNNSAENVIGAVT
jgi:hypothetical protein